MGPSHVVIRIFCRTRRPRPSAFGRLRRPPCTRHHWPSSLRLRNTRAGSTFFTTQAAERGRTSPLAWQRRLPGRPADYAGARPPVPHRQLWPHLFHPRGGWRHNQPAEADSIHRADQNGPHHGAACVGQSFHFLRRRHYSDWVRIRWHRVARLEGGSTATQEDSGMGTGQCSAANNAAQDTEHRTGRTHM